MTPTSFLHPMPRLLPVLVRALFCRHVTVIHPVCHNSRQIMDDPRTILITGASSGIGEALAEAYAGTGIALVLTGRDPTRLEDVAARCHERGAAVRSATVDVAD